MMWYYSQNWHDLLDFRLYKTANFDSIFEQLRKPMLIIGKSSVLCDRVCNRLGSTPSRDAMTGYLGEFGRERTEGGSGFFRFPLYPVNYSPQELPKYTEST